MDSASQARSWSAWTLVPVLELGKRLFLDTHLKVIWTMAAAVHELEVAGVDPRQTFSA
jgi:hypothetical protein